MLAAASHFTPSAGHGSSFAGGTVHPATGGVPPQVLHAIGVLRGVGPTARPLDDREAEALAVIYRCYGGMLLTLTRGLTTQSADAEDILHDVFCRLPNLIAQYRNGGFGGWLKQITARTALMRLRSTRQRGECELDAEDEALSLPPTAEEWETLHDVDALRGAVRSLPAPLRQVLILRVYLDLSHEEIAAALHISKTASEVRLCRAMKLLRRDLLKGKAVVSHPSRSTPTTGSVD